MAKFIEEFKEFAFKGNVMDMAVGVIPHHASHRSCMGRERKRPED